MILPRKRCASTVRAFEINCGSQHHQAAIKELIMARFDKFHAEKNKPPKVTEIPAKPITNGHTVPVEEEGPESAQPASSPLSKISSERDMKDEDVLSDVVDKPPKKKRKAEPLDEDALFAAKLQAEENSRARPTRGGTNRKGAVVKKKKSPVKKKTAKKIKSEDDSDVEGSGSEDKEVNRSGGFHVDSFSHNICSWLTICRSQWHSLLLYLRCWMGRPW